MIIVVKQALEVWHVVHQLILYYVTIFVIAILLIMVAIPVMELLYAGKDM